MLLVKTELKPSKIHGTGVFAIQFIPKNTKIGRFDDTFDRCFSPSQFDNFPIVTRSYIKHFGYFCKTDREYKLNSDNMRFFNHSDSPNTISDIYGNDWSKVDIDVGEEITCNYYDFDMEAHLKLK